MAENYDLIFGQSASSQYAWSDNDYQNGWQTVGSTPPTAEQFDALQRRADLKAQELNNRLVPIEENDTHDYRQPSTAYVVGDIAYHASLPTGHYLECTTGGTTSSGDLTISSPSIGGTVSDGTVVWTIRKIADTTEATTTTKGLMSAADKTKINGVVTTDATTTTHGLMSAADKTKLNGIATGANNYSLPAATGSTRGGVTVGSNISLSGDKISLTSGNVTSALGYTPPTHDTTYGVVTSSANGLMSAADKKKLDGVANNANNYSLPAATGSTRGGVKIGSNISLSGDTISLAKANVTNALGYTPPTTNTTYSTGTASYSGITKLYTALGDNTDGTMTQKAIKAIVGVGGGIIAASLAANGYVKFANGFIVQWGHVTTTGYPSVTFPISFPTAALSFVKSSISADGSAGQERYVVTDSLNKTGVKTGVDRGGCFWIAIGY